MVWWCGTIRCVLFILIVFSDSNTSVFVTLEAHFGGLGVHFGDRGQPMGLQRRPFDARGRFLFILSGFGSLWKVTLESCW